MDRDFLEKRKKDLNAYLQVSLCVFLVTGFLRLPHLVRLFACLQLLCAFQLLLNPEMVKACPTLIPHVYDFLENKAYSKGKGEFARKVSEAFVECHCGKNGIRMCALYFTVFFHFSPRLQIDTFVNPLRSSMRNMSNAVKALPDSLAEGMNKVSDNMGRMSERLGQDIKQSILKVTSSDAQLGAFKR